MNNLYTGLDLDLFFLVKFTSCIELPFLVHIATAGAYVSEELYSQLNSNKIRSKLKNINENQLFKAEISPHLKNVFLTKMNLSSEGEIKFDEDSYKASFVDYAKRGCFSFDRTEIDNDSNKYHLVAYPVIDHKFLKFYKQLFGKNDRFLNQLHISDGFNINLDRLINLLSEVIIDLDDKKIVFINNENYECEIQFLFKKR